MGMDDGQVAGDEWGMVVGYRLRMTSRVIERAG